MYERAKPTIFDLYRQAADIVGPLDLEPKNSSPGWKTSPGPLSERWLVPTVIRMLCRAKFI